MRFKRAGDTRWRSHYHSIVNLVLLYFSVIIAIENIDDTLSAERRGEVVLILDKMRTFEFAFSIHLIRKILEITSELSWALQRKDQDIVNAMDLLKIYKHRF